MRYYSTDIEAKFEHDWAHLIKKTVLSVKQADKTRSITVLYLSISKGCLHKDWHSAQCGAGPKRPSKEIPIWKRSTAGSLPAAFYQPSNQEHNGSKFIDADIWWHLVLVTGFLCQPPFFVRLHCSIHYGRRLPSCTNCVASEEPGKRLNADHLFTKVSDCCSTAFQCRGKRSANEKSNKIWEEPARRRKARKKKMTIKQKVSRESLTKSKKEKLLENCSELFRIVDTQNSNYEFSSSD